MREARFAEGTVTIPTEMLDPALLSQLFGGARGPYDIPMLQLIIPKLHATGGIEFKVDDDGSSLTVTFIATHVILAVSSD
jgi:hypothetical protein